MWSRQILSNKIKLLTVPMTGTRALTVMALFPVGSRYETKPQSGLSHFIEHMLFKGTPRRPTTLDLSRELDGVGAEYNAFTARDHTGYYIKIDAAKAELALDLLADMLWHSKFVAAEIEREKGVILEELKMYQDNPTMYIEQLFEETMFGSHPLGQNVGGRAQTVKKFSHQEILDFYHCFYQPANLVLVLAGGIEKWLQRLVEKYFGERGAKLVRPKFAPIRPSLLKGIRRCVRFKKTDQVHLAMGFPAFSYDDARSIPLALLNLILGATMSSRLFIEVRERRGLAYMIHSGVNHYSEIGNLVIEAGLDQARLKEALKVILTELEKIKKAGITQEELQRAKDNLKGHLVLNCENSNFQAEWYGKQALLMKKIETPEQKLARLNRVTAADIQKISCQIFDQQKLKIALIGPLKDKKRLAGLI